MPVETVDRLRLELDYEASRVCSEIDELFGQLLVSRDDGRDILFAAMRHAAVGGGKRLRPLLTVAAAFSESATNERFVRARRSRRSTSIR
jgi:farnesyl diphosphate synthase